MPHLQEAGGHFRALAQELGVGVDAGDGADALVQDGVPNGGPRVALAQHVRQNAVHVLAGRFVRRAQQGQDLQQLDLAERMGHVDEPSTRLQGWLSSEVWREQEQASIRSKSCWETCMLNESELTRKDNLNAHVIVDLQRHTCTRFGQCL